jgi:pimeloyl-ACP methyl ester carboxylesterase
MIITHGWPGSIIEQLKVIEPLANPTAFGGTEADAFHVVIPSLPGYGFSGKPAAPGWTPTRIAKAWAELMQRLEVDDGVEDAALEAPLRQLGEEALDGVEP